jgi:hypothetical protein
MRRYQGLWIFSQASEPRGAAVRLNYFVYDFIKIHPARRVSAVMPLAAK